MKASDNTKFILKVCELFYIDGKSQKEISAILGISRPQVSRLIARAKEKNLISIKLNYPNKDEHKFQSLISEKYGISEVYVYDIGKLSGPEGRYKLAEASKPLFNVLVKDNETVGVMAGKTIECLSEVIDHSRNRGLSFVPLCGGLGSNGESWYANNICQNFAIKTNGRYYLLNAPNFLSNEKTKKILLQEESITKIMAMGEHCNTALIGIGSVNKESTGSVAGSLSASDIQTLRSEGAVANICCSYVNAEGNVINTSIGNRILGKSISDISSCRKVGMAMGPEKVEAIKAVLKGKLIDVFITSLDTAEKLI